MTSHSMLIADPKASDTRTKPGGGLWRQFVARCDRRRVEGRVECRVERRAERWVRGAGEGRMERRVEGRVGRRVDPRHECRGEQYGGPGQRGDSARRAETASASRPSPSNRTLKSALKSAPDAAFYAAFHAAFQSVFDTTPDATASRRNQPACPND